MTFKRDLDNVKVNHFAKYLVQSSGVSTGEQGACPLRFQAEKDSHAKVPHFLTHNDAIAGFTIKSIVQLQ